MKIPDKMIDYVLSISVTMNDVFAPAADGYDIDIEDIPLAIELFEKFGYDGLVALASLRENIKPMQITDKYKEATEYLENKNN